MTEPSVPHDLSDPGGTGAAPVAPDPVPRASGSWWARHRRQVWLFLAFLAAVTAPVWGGLILLWLFAPSSPFPKGP